MKYLFKLSSLAAAAAIMAGCAVTHEDTNKKADALRAEMDREVSNQQHNVRPAKNPLYKRVHAVYVGTASASIVNNASLPPAINELSFQLPKRTNLATAAKNIQKITRYPVRINPDVFSRNPDAGPVVAPSASAGEAAISNLLSATVPDGDTSLPTDFEGSLKDYLDTIAAQLNINWEFDPNKGFSFYRYMTKVLEVKMNLGDVDLHTDLRKGTQASTGTSATSGSGGGASADSGAYSSTTSSISSAKYSAWAALEASVKAVMSPVAKVVPDMSTSSMIVRGTRDDVEQAEEVVKHANQVHGRMIILNLRIMRVSYDDTSDAGANFQAAYAALSAGVPKYGLTFTSPGSLVGSDGGGLGYQVLDPKSRWNGTQGLIQAIQQLGTVVSDESQSYPVMNGRTYPVASFDTDTYLAETTPAAGGVLGAGSAGIPGLKPGTLTTGSYLDMTPTAFDDGTVSINMNLDQSQKRGPFGVASSGSGDTFQQIQLPNTHVDTKAPSVQVKAGETLMLSSSSSNVTQHSQKSGLVGVSGSGEHQREMQIILVTPYVRTL
jgi:type IVB pilus formation R64 PilN family outer membrane protein